MKNLVTVLTTSLICLLLSVPSFAADIAGRVIMAKGQVSAIDAEGVERALKRRDKVFNTDTIKTGNNGQIQVRFIDKALLAIKPNSTMVIEAYQFKDEAQQKDDKVLMKLVEGGFRTLSGTIGKGNKAAYEVKTPVASIGIRGTHYEVELVNSEMFLAVWDGAVDLFVDGQSPVGFGSSEDFMFGSVSPKGGVKQLLSAPEIFSKKEGGSEGSDSSEGESDSSSDEGESDEGSEEDSSEESGNESKDGSEENKAAEADNKDTGSETSNPPAEAPKNESPAPSVNPVDNDEKISKLSEETCETNKELCEQVCAADDGKCGDIGLKPTFKTEDIRFSDSEYQLLVSNTSTTRSYAAGGDKGFHTLTFTNSDDEIFVITMATENKTQTVRIDDTTQVNIDIPFPIYSSPNNFSVDGVLRGSGTAPTKFDLPDYNGGAMTNVSWGEWTSTADQPFRYFDEKNKDTFESFSETLYWLDVQPLDSKGMDSLRSSVLAGAAANSNAILTFDGYSGGLSLQGSSSKGAVSAASMASINFNLTTGEINGGHIDVNAGTSYWFAPIKGGILNGSEFAGVIEGGNLSDATGTGIINCTACVNGNIGGSFFNPDNSNAVSRDNIAIGGFLSLVATQGDLKENLSGVFIWTRPQP